MKLYYIHDPMCSWCWGFRPVWDQIENHFNPRLTIEYVMGGLAPDSTDPMPEEMRGYIQMNWRKVQEAIPGTEFNFDFWEKCQPRRSTYPACRAVIAAKFQGDQYEKLMNSAIQNAYYLGAQNPSDDSTLITLAGLIGLDVKQFESDLNSDAIQQKLSDHINFYQQLAMQTGANGFPSLILDINNKRIAVPRNYIDLAFIITWIQHAIDL